MGTLRWGEGECHDADMSSPPPSRNTSPMCYVHLTLVGMRGPAVHADRFIPPLLSERQCMLHWFTALISHSTKCATDIICQQNPKTQTKRGLPPSRRRLVWLVTQLTKLSWNTTHWHHQVFFAWDFSRTLASHTLHPSLRARPDFQEGGRGPLGVLITWWCMQGYCAIAQYCGRADPPTIYGRVLTPRVRTLPYGYIYIIYMY